MSNKLIPTIERERKAATGGATQAACFEPDWTQVILNGGPPCFHVENCKFCFRAERWPGHPYHHPYVSLLDFYTALTEEAGL